MGQQVENRLHFGIPIFEANIADFQPKQSSLITSILNMMDKDQGISRSNHGGWHSEDNLHQSSDELMKWLAQSIYNVGSQCIRHSETDDYQGDVLLSSCWANVNPSGAWNAPHVHLPCEWSGVAYISVNESPQQRGTGARDGDIMFFDPLPAGPQYRRDPTVSYTPKNGSMFIFPGYLLHMVAPHFDKDPRISVSFNFRLSDQIQGIAK